MDIPRYEVYEQTLYNVRDGILRWLNRPENEWLIALINGERPAYMTLEDVQAQIYEDMGAEMWLDPIARGLANINAIVAETEDIDVMFDLMNPRPATFPCGYTEALWGDAITQVCLIAQS